MTTRFLHPTRSQTRPRATTRTTATTSVRQATRPTPPTRASECPFVNEHRRQLVLRGRSSGRPQSLSDRAGRRPDVDLGPHGVRRDAVIAVRRRRDKMAEADTSGRVAFGVALRGAGAGGDVRKVVERFHGGAVAVPEAPGGSRLEERPLDLILAALLAIRPPGRAELVDHAYRRYSLWPR